MLFTTSWIFKPRWQSAYSSLSHFNEDIYDSLLMPVTLSELNSVVSSLPTGKAPGLSGINYEMIKHLPEIARLYICDLISGCFKQGVIPSSWKDATIFPISK